MTAQAGAADGPAGVAEGRAGVADAAAVARRMWMLAEPVHVMTYFTAEGRAAYEAAGLRGFWRGYFAGRAGALGPVGAAPVIAAFYGFAPPMVERALPAVWQLISPGAAMAARTAGAVAALRRVLDGAGLASDGAATEAVADELYSVLAGADCGGRVLGAANLALPVPDEPLARLWLAATVLREHRGDGHIAALVAADLDGLEVQVLRAGLDMHREVMQPNRGWTDEEWDAAAARLAGRGLLGADGRATPDGEQLVRDLEAATDRAAARPWASVDPGAAADLAGRLGPISAACRAEMPPRTPIGLPYEGR
jgi:hypothetical protein